MKLKRLLAVGLLASLFTSLIAGCSAPDFLTPGRRLYDRYIQEICETERFAYSAEIHVSVNSENWERIRPVVKEFPDAFSPLEETIQISGQVERPEKRATTDIGFEKVYQGRKTTAPFFTSAMLDGSILYLNAASIYEKLAREQEVAEPYPLEQDYINANIGALAERMWQGRGAEETGLVEALENLRKSYLKENAAFEKQKDYAGFTSTDLAPSSIFLDVADTLNNDHNGVRASCKDLISAWISDGAQARLVEVADEVDETEPGDGGQAGIISLANTLKRVDSYLARSEAETTDRINSFADDLAQAKLVHRLTSDIHLQENGYLLECSYILGTLYESDNALPLISVDFSVEIDTIAEVSIERPAASVKSSAVMEKLLSPFLAQRAAEEIEAIVPAEEQGSPQADEQDIEVEYSRVMTPGAFTASILESSDLDHFAGVALNGQTVYGVKSALQNDGVILYEASSVDRTQEYLSTSSTAGYIDGVDGVAVKHTFLEYPEGYSSIYSSEESLIYAKLFETSANRQTNVELKTANRWTYWIQESSGAAKYRLMAVKVDHDNMVELLEMAAGKAEHLNEFIGLFAPNAELYVPATPDTPEESPEPSQEPVQASIVPSAAPTVTPAQIVTPSPVIPTPSPSAARSTPTPQAAEASQEAIPIFQQVEYGGKKLWAVSASLSDGTSYGEVENQTDRTTVGYTSYGTSDNSELYVSDQYVTFISESALTEQYETVEDIYAENIDWAMNTYFEHSKISPDISERKNSGSFFYRTADFTEESKNRSITIAVQVIDRKTFEILFLDTTGAGDLNMYLRQLLS